MDRTRGALGRTSWSIREDGIDAWRSGEEVGLQPMQAGLEASIYLVEAGDARYVLKVWDKASKPDAEYQYRLLRALREKGLAVSAPLGVGQDEYGNAVLLTSYDGAPIARLDKRGIETIARLMADIHRFEPDEEASGLRLYRHEFVGYFFPGLDGFPDLRERVNELVAAAGPKHEAVIHGDLHLGNLVELDGRYTSIDWTNGQLGDPRYDLMWAVTLTRIYVSARHADGWKKAYLASNPYPEEQLRRFEAIAFLRWLLLHRQGLLPIGAPEMERIEALVRENEYLNGYDLFPVRA